uniref:Uncharacterized protein n=1 Tax=Parascaris equorum TaxID=6256 RepID=A0A914REU7_PAREQ
MGSKGNIPHWNKDSQRKRNFTLIFIRNSGRRVFFQYRKMTELVKNLPASKRPDISKPRWPQNTYEGRLRHYWATANPLNLFHTTAEIEAAKRIVLDYRQDFDHHLFFGMPCKRGSSSLLF